MATKIWIATYVDNSETCDGKARVLDVYKSKEEAKAAVRNDIEHWCDYHAGENYAVDFDRMITYFAENGDGCEWNIEECLLDVTEEDEQADVIDDGQLEIDVKEV